MRALPGLTGSDLAGALADGWGLPPDGLQYVPVGGGSYHWRAGADHWVTVDDLDQKDFLGSTREAVWDGLRRALDTARTLRDAGLDFVVAPEPSRHGGSALRLDRYAVAVYPYLDGAAGEFGGHLPAEHRAELVDRLVRLHRAAPPGATRPVSPVVPFRAGLEEALRSHDRPWPTGAYAEEARAVVATHHRRIRHLLDTFDALVRRVAGGAEPVVTHGEPHPGNVLVAGGRPLLIDWDTVALAPAERDLWMLDTGGDDLARYTEATGRPLDPAAIRLYRLRWQLDDIASALAVLRSPDPPTADTERNRRWFAGSVESDGVWPHARG